MDNFYCNGEWFSTMSEALAYSGKYLEIHGVYKVVYTKAEMDAVINHEMECGK